METLTNPHRFAPAPGGQGRQSSFLGAVFASLMVLFLAGILYFTHVTDFSSPQSAPAERLENPPTVQDTGVDAPVTGPSIGTTANLASYSMFAPLLGQQADAAPMVFR
ncbi:hypothetical protein [Rufibacter sp. XAAS-G3-1]|uniref:hypothetical protein n=1 Tax=Rufibacter sp. XAAS-G3-1 TaxID=2729134 RepID=UPI0015E752F6|nr:hypothetical protein [Rufibacter sp. XAAS-G3-1]